ncbi:MAG: hypothetical protein KAU12_00495, partial [Candidatus Omnitrophica bacterium]|nr:hypothetical protein [Candidatus Omnitrophota bacterium]
KCFIFFVYLLIIICIGMSAVIKEAAAADNYTKIKLTTCDLHKEYTIKGVVVYRSGMPDLEKINEELIKQAGKLKADCIIGVRYLEAMGYLFGYGTAVKVK